MVDFDEEDALKYPLFQDDFGEPGDRELQDKIVTARKPHKCCECLSEITVGMRYRLHVGIYSSELHRYHFCDACCEAMSRVFDSDDDDCDPMQERERVRAKNEEGGAA